MKLDNIPLIQEQTGITISSNITKIIADSQLTTTTGKTLIELQFINKTTGEKKATFNLVLIVIASTIAIDASISTATYTLLEELENKLDQATDYFKNVSAFINEHGDIINLDGRTTENEKQITYRTSQIYRTLEKLKNKEPVIIVCYGNKLLGFIIFCSHRFLILFCKSTKIKL
jgi:hypothetical protein